MGQDAEAFVARFADLFRHLYATDDILAFLVRGHLYCESALATLLRTNLRRPDALDVDRLEYQAKVRWCDALGVIPSGLVPGLAQLGKLRNKFVHQLNYAPSEADQTDLVNTIRSTLGEPAQFLLSRGGEFPNPLRRCVLALWVPLELAAAKDSSVAKDMLVGMAALMVSATGMSQAEYEREIRERVEEWEALRKKAAQQRDAADEAGDG